MKPFIHGLVCLLLLVLTSGYSYAYRKEDIKACQDRSKANYHQACIRLLEFPSLPPSVLSLANVGAGHYYYLQKHFDQALPFFHQAIVHNPANKEAYIYKGRSQAALGQFKKAITTYNLGIQYSKINNSKVYYSRGYARFMLKEYHEAIRDLTRYILANPNNSQALYLRGFALHYLGSAEEALRDYNTALMLDPKNANIFLNRANLLVSFQQYEQAFDDYNLALKYRPNHATTYYRRGTVLRYMGQLNNSIQDCRTATRLQPLYFYGWVCFAKGHIIKLYKG